MKIKIFSVYCSLYFFLLPNKSLTGKSESLEALLIAETFFLGNRLAFHFCGEVSNNTFLLRFDNYLVIVLHPLHHQTQFNLIHHFRNHAILSLFFFLMKIHISAPILFFLISLLPLLSINHCVITFWSWYMLQYWYFK
jgi:hypothetical protein